MLHMRFRDSVINSVIYLPFQRHVDYWTVSLLMNHVHWYNVIYIIENVLIIQYLNTPHNNCGCFFSTAVVKFKHTNKRPILVICTWSIMSVYECSELQWLLRAYTPSILHENINGCERPSLQHQSNAVAPLGAPSMVWTQPVQWILNRSPSFFYFIFYIFFIF